MAKFYITSGPVRLIFDAATPLNAAVKAFQWTCDKQAAIDADTSLEHVLIAEANGWQMHDEVRVSERGFDGSRSDSFETIDVLAAWHLQPAPIV